MSGGLAALLDDIAALAKLAAASVDDVGAASARVSVKAAGVVVDDTAVTPRFVEGVTAEREVPIIKKIAIGSLRNKLLIILPAAIVLSIFVPWLVNIILMLGGAYLSFEGAEKIWERISGHQEAAEEQTAAKDEDTIVSGAIRTDLILSAEIMVISLKEVADQTIWMRVIILIVVAIAITALVYGVVAVIVKLDDMGLKLMERPSEAAQKFGRGMVQAMPKILAVISVVGIAAMTWVGGHILLVGANELGWHAPYALVHHGEQAVAGVAAVGGFLAWLLNTLASAVIGLVVGAVIVAALHALPFGFSHAGAHADQTHEPSKRHREARVQVEDAAAQAGMQPPDATDVPAPGSGH